METLKYTVDFSSPGEGILAVVKHFVPSWASATLENAKYEMVSGGITNKLFKCWIDGSPDTVVLVRMYGEKTELLIDREMERLVLEALSARNMRPRLLGLFTNGQIQEFISARTLVPEDMAEPKMVPRIARKLAQLHKVEIDRPKVPILWDTVARWLAVARACEFTDPVKLAKLKEVDIDGMEREVAALKKIVENLPSPLVLGHHDLLSGNILVDAAEDMFFIDFEYAMYSYRGADIGNHFQEYAGFECDYSRFPDRDAQYLFYRAYLQEFTGSEPTEEDLASMYTEVTIYGLAAHLYWGIWAIVQGCYSTIDFDYLGYAKLRFDEYLRQKKLYVPSS